MGEKSNPALICSSSSHRRPSPRRVFFRPSGLVARSGGSPLGAGPEGPAAPAAASLRSVKLVLGDGTQLMVAKRKRRVEDEELEGEEGSVATLAGADGRVVHKVKNETRSSLRASAHLPSPLAPPLLEGPVDISQSRAASSLACV